MNCREKGDDSPLDRSLRRIQVAPELLRGNNRCLPDHLIRNMRALSICLIVLMSSVLYLLQPHNQKEGAGSVCKDDQVAREIVARAPTNMHMMLSVVA